MSWVQQNWPYLSLVLFGISEILGAVPSIKANGLADAVIKAVEGFTKPKPPGGAELKL